MSNIPAFLNEFMLPPQEPVLKKWSFSAWSLFKDVPYLLYAQEVLGKKRDAGAAANRGTEMHAQLENYIIARNAEIDGQHVDIGKTDINPVGLAFVMRLYNQGYAVKPEAKVLLDRDWKIASDKEARSLTAIIDVLAMKDDHVVIGDFKSGRKYDLKHTQQAQLYAAVVNQVLGVDTCRAEFIYLDGHSPLVIEFDKRLMRQAVDFWKAEGERLLTYGRDAFAPPESLQGIPKWYHEFLSDPGNYDNDHFSPPWYANNT